MGFSFNALTGQFDLVGSGGSNPNFANPVADEASLPAGADGMLVVVKSTDHVYVYDGTTSKWVDTGLTASAFGATPNANGYTLQVDTSGGIVRNKVILQPADSTNPGSVSISAQSFSGNKTFDDNITVTGVTQADGGLDVSTLGGTLSIGSTNASTINIGTAGATVNIVGSVNNNNVTNLNVTDALITLNDGGGAGSAAGSGFEIEEAGSPTGYVKTSGDRNSFILKAPNTAGIATVTPGASGITLNQSSHDPVTLAPVGSSPNANGASLSSQVLTLQVADGTNPGLVSTGAQTLAGAKTFSSLITGSSGLTITGTTTLDSSLTGPVKATAGVISTSLIDLTAEVTGVLPIANGGTGSATQNFVDLSSDQTVGGEKTFSTVISANAGIQTTDLTASGTTTLATGLTGPLKATAGVVTASAIDLTTETSGVLPIASGGTGSASQNFVDLTTAQSVAGAKTFTDAFTVDDSLTVTGVTTLSTALSGVVKAASGVISASAVDLATSDVTGVLPVANGGTNSSTALNNNRLIWSATGAIVEAPQLQNGELFIGDSTGAPVASTLGAGAGIVITNDAGTIDIASTTVASEGDINENGDTLLDNQASPVDIVGFAFNNAVVRSFEAQVSLVRGSTYAVYKLTGIQRAADWALDQSFVGDITGITFSITTAGQIQYTSSNLSQTTDLRFRAQTLSI